MSVNNSGVFASPYSRCFEWSGYTLGFAIGGFFDGILLHQVLQWHHLLSGVEQARFDIRVLILTDGLFHLLMYLVAGIGLFLLWRSRKEFAATGGDRRLMPNALIGFGLWHIVDSILSHWILGIHRIRMDVDNPLFWDLLWFVGFGLLPLAVGWQFRQGKTPNDSRIMSAPIALVMATVLMGPLAALPPPDQSQVVVLFRPNISEVEAFAAIHAVGGQVIGSDLSGQVWAVEMQPGSEISGLYRRGAVLISNSLLPLGCFSWTRA